MGVQQHAIDASGRCHHQRPGNTLTGDVGDDDSQAIGVGVAPDLDEVVEVPAHLAGRDRPGGDRESGNPRSALGEHAELDVVGNPEFLLHPALHEILLEQLGVLQRDGALVGNSAQEVEILRREHLARLLPA
jgi:hypothetical protein